MKNKIMCVIMCLILAGCGCPNNIPVVNSTNSVTTVNPTIYLMKQEVDMGYGNKLIEVKEITEEEANKLKEEKAIRLAQDIVVRMKVMTDFWLHLGDSYYKHNKSLDNPPEKVYPVGQNDNSVKNESRQTGD
jgi:hypothetical protein